MRAYSDAKVPGQVGFGGKPSQIIPELPWASKEITLARCAELRKEPQEMEAAKDHKITQ
jgi:hypothetical protein